MEKSHRRVLKTSPPSLDELLWQTKGTQSLSIRGMYHSHDC
jgi:hypothetical protein